MARTVHNPPTVQESWVRFLGQEDPLEKGMATTPAFLPEKSHGQRSLAGYSPCGHKESDTTEQLKIHLLIYTGQGASGHSCDSLPGPLFILEEGLYPQKGEQM